MPEAVRVGRTPYLDRVISWVGSPLFFGYIECEDRHAHDSHKNKTIGLGMVRQFVNFPDSERRLFPPNRIIEIAWEQIHSDRLASSARYARPRSHEIPARSRVFSEPQVWTVSLATGSRLCRSQTRAASARFWRSRPPNRRRTVSPHFQSHKSSP